MSSAAQLAGTPSWPISPQNIDGVVPGIRGQRALPVRGGGQLDPFLLLDHIGPQRVPGDWITGGGAHPHRGFETVTFLFSGAMEHADSLGSRFWMRSGDVQIMNAGKGIQHGGRMAADPAATEFHEVQLWLNLPAAHKLSEPSVRTIKAEEIPEMTRSGVVARVIAGDAFGLEGPVRPTLPLLAVHAKLDRGASLALPIPEGWTALAYGLRGDLSSGGVLVSEHELLPFHGTGGELEVQASSGPAEVLLLAAPPIGEPVVMGGPFVMNTRAEISAAFADFRAGRFGTVPPPPSSTVELGA